MSIGKNIYMLRKEKLLTQGQLAEKLGVSTQAVSKWENDQCAPDVSMFPILANLFGVSIDRLFGYYEGMAKDAVREIQKRADESESLFEEIETFRDGLRRYPGSVELKVSLAFAVSQMRHVSRDAAKIASAEEESVRLCSEVIDTCGDRKQVDEALFLLARLAADSGEYGRAETYLDRISAERFQFRIFGLLDLLGKRKEYRRQREIGEDALWRLSRTMESVFVRLREGLLAEGKNREALAFLEAHEKFLSVFDEGCPDFYIAAKYMLCEEKARILMLLGEKERCLTELRLLFTLAEQIRRTAAQNDDFRVSVRNPLFFGFAGDDCLEEWMPDAQPKYVLPSFDAFFGDDEAYRQLRQQYN